MQTGGKIIGAAVRDIPHRRALLQCHQTAQRFVQRAVAAGTNHQIKFASQLGSGPPGIAGSLSGKQLDEIPRLRKPRHHLEHGGHGAGAARLWINNKQQLFHENLLRGVVFPIMPQVFRNCKYRLKVLANPAAIEYDYIVHDGRRVCPGQSMVQ